MGVRVRLDGFEDFRAALRALPTELAQQAEGIVEGTAREVGDELVTNYPERTGNLRRGVRVTIDGSRLGVKATVRSGSPHAHLFEQGTQSRQTRTGANRGVMPQAPDNQRLVPRAIRARQKMRAQLVQLVREAGLMVPDA